MMADMDRNATLRYISGATIQYANTVSKKQPEEKNLKIQRKWHERKSACTAAEIAPAEGITGQLNLGGHERGHYNDRNMRSVWKS